MIKVGSNEVIFPYSKIYVGDTLVWQDAQPASFPTYIEADGTQVISTGIDGNAAYKVEADFELTYVVSSGASGVLFGNTNTYGYDMYGRFAYRGPRRMTYVTVNTADLNRHQMVMNNGDDKYYFDNAEVTAVGTNAKFSSGNICIFSSTNVGDINRIKAKLYSFKITDTSTNTVVCNMVPVVDTNGKAGLYDSVSGNIFYDYFGGTFAYA